MTDLATTTLATTKKKDADYVFYELTRSICPREECRRVISLDFEQAKALARSTAETIRAGKLGYAVITGVKPSKP